MSFERNRFGFDGEISFECDKCGNERHAEVSDFLRALEHVKSFGWIVKKDGSDWLHFCSKECARG